MTATSPMMGQMMSMPLLISSLLTHAARYAGDTEIVSKRVEGDLHRYGWRDAELRARQLAQAFAPQSVTLRLSDEIDIARGDVIAAADDAPEVTQDLTGTLAWLAERPLLPGQRVLVKHGTSVVQAAVRDVIGRLNLDTTELEPTERLELNDIGRVTLRLAAPIAAEEYLVSRRMGAFLVIDPTDGYTLAAGMVGDALAAVRFPGERPIQYAI